MAYEYPSMAGTVRWSRSAATGCSISPAAAPATGHRLTLRPERRPPSVAVSPPGTAGGSRRPRTCWTGVRSASCCSGRRTANELSLALIRDLGINVRENRGIDVAVRQGIARGSWRSPPVDYGRGHGAGRAVARADRARIVRASAEQPRALPCLSSSRSARTATRADAARPLVARPAGKPGDGHAADRRERRSRRCCRTPRRTPGWPPTSERVLPRRSAVAGERRRPAGRFGGKGAAASW